MKIGGKVYEWNVLLGQFKIETPTGDIIIRTGGCSHTLEDMLINAMKERKMIYIEVEDDRNVKKSQRTSKI